MDQATQWFLSHLDWLGFAAFVVVMLTLDLGVFHRHSRETTIREASIWTAVWCLLALAFNAILWGWKGKFAAQEFLAGYLVEWALSMDNVFVFAVIFNFFHVPRKFQHRVLFWGILGAVGMRLAFILIGSAAIQRWDWILPLLGVVLVVTGVKLAFKGDSDVHPDKNPVLVLARKVMRVAKGEHGEQFFVREAGKWAVTPLFLVLLVVETTDVVFAVDSVPAILGLVNKKAPYFSYVVFTSNVFAILGLRALYFLLAGMMDMFRYLVFGLSGILVFVGCKMVAQFAADKFGWVEEGHHLIGPAVSLLVIASLLAISVCASLWAARRSPSEPSESPSEGGKPSAPGADVPTSLSGNG